MLSKLFAEELIARSMSRLATHLGGGLLGLASLGWIATHCGPPTGRAVIHVAEADVELTVGASSYRIEELRPAPIICELPSGVHELVLLREGRVLRRESFSLRGGESVVLTAWDPVRLSGGTETGADRARDLAAPPAQ
ncbi:hypothetical protein [Tautonia plasticadhaerens]|uniref:PEGA domain protein n=1 Tax=Tautonia plasticadhaerens TaxID=2527974 RepID=A0A518H6T4_9BACT|nr:hypothetical protein [Tautonia plasticadhaerens]QDV36533.1 hypothetical protein ElP_44590 [Tautonia plasticadhaerens]